MSSDLLRLGRPRKRSLQRQSKPRYTGLINKDAELKLKGAELKLKHKRVKFADGNTMTGAKLQHIMGVREKPKVRSEILRALVVFIRKHYSTGPSIWPLGEEWSRYTKWGVWARLGKRVAYFF